MCEQLDLPINHEPSLDHWAKNLADLSIENGESSDWDHAYESAWWLIEFYVENQDLYRSDLHIVHNIADVGKRDLYNEEV